MFQLSTHSFLWTSRNICMHNPNSWHHLTDHSLSLSLSPYRPRMDRDLVPSLSNITDHRMHRAVRSRRVHTILSQWSRDRQQIERWEAVSVCGVVWCCVVWCGVVWCGVVWFDVVWCDVTWCDVMRCVEMWCDVLWCVFCDTTSSAGSAILSCLFVSGFMLLCYCASRRTLVNVLEGPL